MKMNMNAEIQKYKGRIYYYEQSTHEIIKADWINSTDDYNHDDFELHHVVPHTDWEKNTRNVRDIVKENALIGIAKKMHQHLENPLYKLSKSDFERVWGIHPDEILYDVNSRLPREKDLFFVHMADEQNTKNTQELLCPKSALFLTLNDLTDEDINSLEVCFGK